MDSEPRNESGALHLTHNDADLTIMSGEKPSHALTDSSRNRDNFSKGHVAENENDFGNEMGYSTINLEHLDSFMTDQSVKQTDTGVPHHENVESIDVGDYDYGIRFENLSNDTSQSRILESAMNAETSTCNKSEGMTDGNKLESIKTNFSKFLEVIRQMTVETVKEVHKNVIEQTLNKTIGKILNTKNYGEQEISEKVIRDALYSEPYTKDDHTNSKHEDKKGKTKFHTKIYKTQIRLKSIHQ